MILAYLPLNNQMKASEQPLKTMEPKVKNILE